MLNYHITYYQPHQHLLKISLTLDTSDIQECALQLPAWRPGRYQIGNFAKNILRLDAESENQKDLPCFKLTKDCWQVNCKEANTTTITWFYYAGERNAGSSWIDEEQALINFINCLVFPTHQTGVSCNVTLDFPEDFTLACGLEQPQPGQLKANNYFELADSPLLAGNNLRHRSYKVNGTRFNMWFAGDWAPSDKNITQNITQKFEQFTREQLELFGEFPFKEYHFLYDILPYRFYHGVEHHNSTVISLGPSEKMDQEKNMHHFLGVSSHELFHAWNIMKIRPKEMMPYDLSRENYFTTGYVAEGNTTYYGDYMLARAGVYSEEAFLEELSNLVNRHFNNFGRFNLSVADSSFDLWLDGYERGTPHRKTSIYIKGGICALILDLEIRRLTKNQKSLDTVMQKLWEDFGKNNKGYTPEDYKKVTEQVSEHAFDKYFSQCIYGTTPLEKWLEEALNFVGLTFQATPSENPGRSVYGFTHRTENGKVLVDKVAPQSPASYQLAPGDEIISVEYRKAEKDNFEDLMKRNPGKVTLHVFRENKLKTAVMEKARHHFMPAYKVTRRRQITDKQKSNLNTWLKKTGEKA